eukprot:TRINITY_DN36733_c0_g1_i1.p1 TRINITY_DN36733_c0_g1~~TRINITY_DN36733_c0_g1_i1.p1  ORF type:complete len:388 (-),score=43.01 TRINITY_DN36733_c0_g1_i1:84-1247(-)
MRDALPAAGGYQRTDGQLPRRCRSASPPRLHMQGGCLFEHEPEQLVDSRVAGGYTRGNLDSGGLLTAEGIAAPRRIRAAAIGVQAQLKGAAVDGATDEFTVSRSAREIRTFDSSTTTRERVRVRQGVDAQAGSIRESAREWRIAEDLPPEAAAKTFPSQRRNLSPATSIGAIVEGDAAGQRGASLHQDHADIFGNARPSRGNGRPRQALLTSGSQRSPSPRSPRIQVISPRETSENSNGQAGNNRSTKEQHSRCKVHLAEAMEASKPIICSEFFSGEDQKANRDSTLSEVYERRVRRQGEFASQQGQRVGSPRGLRSTEQGLQGPCLLRKGDFSPRDKPSNLWGPTLTESQMPKGKVDFLHGSHRWKHRVESAPKTGGVSAALQWRG